MYTWACLYHQQVWGGEHDCLNCQPLWGEGACMCVTFTVYTTSQWEGWETCMHLIWSWLSTPPTNGGSMFMALVI